MMKILVLAMVSLPVMLALPKKYPQDKIHNVVNGTGKHGKPLHIPNSSTYLHVTHTDNGSSDESDIKKRMIFPETPVYARLQHGTSAHDGRAEIYALNRWGTICDYDWNDRDAAVICHMLGFPRTGAKARTTGNGIGSGVILLDDVHCVGTEDSIKDCPANSIGTNDCTHLEDAGVTCDNSTRADNFLIFTDSLNSLIFRMDLNTNSFVLLPLKRSDNPISIDYDPVDGKVYWTEVTLREIHSITIDAQDQHVVKYLGDSKNLSRDMRFPTMCVIYWSDWGSHPKIEKANYDGSNRQTIVSSGLGFPNALSLDLQGNKLYWADAKTDKIEVVNLDGSGRRTIYEEPLSHIFGLTLYGNFLYFTDWTKSAVMRASVLGGTGTAAEPVGPPGFGRLNDIHVHKNGYGVSGPNGCSTNNGGCSGICIPTPARGSRCL